MTMMNSPVMQETTRPGEVVLTPRQRAAAIEMARRGLTLNSRYGIPKDYSKPPKWFHAGQKRLWESSSLDTVACAGTQGGKTKSEAPWLLREIQRSAPLIKALKSGKFIFAGPTLTLLKAQAIPHFKELFQEQEQLGRLIEGNQPVFRFSSAGLQKVLGFTDCPVTVHFAYTKDSSNLESMTALAGVWDEAGQKENKQDSYEAYNRRLTVARSTTLASVYNTAPGWWRERYGNCAALDETFGHRLWGTTPYEWNWFKNLVVDKAEKGQGGFSFFNWPAWMNPLVSEAECRSKITNGMALWKWEMMYLGRFTRPAGAIYDTFDFDLDTCEPFLIPKDWTEYPGVDFGSVNMGSNAVAEDPATKDLYVVDEYLAGNKSFPDHAADIKAGSDAWKALQKRPHAFRPGAGGSHQEEGWREAFRNNGLAIDEPPVGDVEVGIGCVYGELKTRRLKVFRSCVKTIEQFQLYSREIGTDGEPTEIISNKASYHLLDDLRYIVSKLRPPKLVPPANKITRSGGLGRGYA